MFVGLLLLLLVGLLWLKSRLDDSSPRFSRNIGQGASSAAVNWVHYFDASVFSEPSLADTLVIIYIARDFSANLVALESSTGRVQWTTDLPLEQRGIKTLVSSYQIVYAGTARGIVAYKALTGEQLWSTQLGHGGVSIIAQLDSRALRVYYGQDIYELDPTTGQIVAKEPKPAPVWIADGVAIYRLTDKHIEGIDIHTGLKVWDNHDQALLVDEVVPPVTYQDQTLIVGTDTRGICALDLKTGTYNWCRQESYISKISIDSQTDLGYILRKDFVLLQIDLRTGNLLQETQILPAQLPQSM
jgi:outer membrane protein assembly factor BamB